MGVSWFSFGAIFENIFAGGLLVVLALLGIIGVLYAYVNVCALLGYDASAVLDSFRYKLGYYTSEEDEELAEHHEWQKTHPDDL